jgi:hypothetical protein
MGSHFRSTIASISISGSREFSRPERLAAKNQLFNLPECRLEGGESLYMKRLNRLTLAFSKKLENFEAAVGLHFASLDSLWRTLRNACPQERWLSRSRSLVHSS